MLPILLAALSAAIWGTGDFCGGKAARRASALAVTVLSQLAGLPALVLCLALIGQGQPTPTMISRGALAGVAGFLGILLLYRGLAQGSMALFAPVTAVTAAVVPVTVGLVLDRRPSTVALAGVGCAIVAIGLVSSGSSMFSTSPHHGSRTVGLALAAGAMFGVFFALLGRTGSGAGLWPLVGVRLGSLGIGLIAVAISRTSLRLHGTPLRWTVLAGTFDIVANALYLLAAAHGLLSIVAPIAALYPVSTVLLALGVDRERIRPVQLAGLGLAATALVLVAT